MEIVTKPYSALPCALETFMINGKNGDLYDFGECETYGDCFECGCCNRFSPNEAPMENILEKYQITNDEYNEICSILKEELCVNNCGWCS